MRTITAARDTVSRGSEAERAVLRQRASEIASQNAAALAAVQASRATASQATRKQRSLRWAFCLTTFLFLIVVLLLVGFGLLEREALVRCWNSNSLRASTCGSDGVACRGT